MTIEGVAFDGPLSGCTVCADVNGNGGCDGFEPSTTTNSTGGYTVEVTAAQRAVMLAEDGSLLLPQCLQHLISGAQRLVKGFQLAVERCAVG